MLYAVIKFYTQFSHRQRSEGNVFKISFKDNIHFVLEKCLYENYELRNGIVKLSVPLELEADTSLRIPSFGVVSDWFSIPFDCGDSSAYVLFFSMEKEDDLNLLLEVDGINGLLKFLRRG